MYFCTYRNQLLNFSYLASYICMLFYSIKDAFIGYGGNVVRQKVKEDATWFVTDFQELIDILVAD